MSHAYNEPIVVTVSSGSVSPSGSVSSSGSASSGVILEPPKRFRWRGRLYIVLSVLAQWIEADSWWAGSGRSAIPAAEPKERRVWRVEAQSTRSQAPGVYDLCLDADEGQWQLARSVD